MQKHFDLIAIGAGPAGQKGAVQAAKLKKNVAVVEREAHPGGICVYSGTLPSKTLRETVTFYHGFRKRSLRGVSFTMDKTMTLYDLMRHKDKVIQHEQQIISDQLHRNDVRFIQGDAQFIDPHTISISNAEGIQTHLHADYFLIATGSHSIHPSYIPDLDDPIFDSDTILRIRQIPRTLTVLGGGSHWV